MELSTLLNYTFGASKPQTTLNHEDKGPTDKAPKLMIRAMRDPDGANLDRVQVIKGWVEADGELQERVYDVRVIEIPTPRWTTHDAVFYGLELPEGVPASQQDRAYTSPIWYTP